MDSFLVERGGQLSLKLGIIELEGTEIQSVEVQLIIVQSVSVSVAVRSSVKQVTQTEALWRAKKLSDMGPKPRCALAHNQPCFVGRRMQPCYVEDSSSMWLHPILHLAEACGGRPFWLNPRRSALGVSLPHPFPPLPPQRCRGGSSLLQLPDKSQFTV